MYLAGVIDWHRTILISLDCVCWPKSPFLSCICENSIFYQKLRSLLYKYKMEQQNRAYVNKYKPFKNIKSTSKTLKN